MRVGKVGSAIKALVKKRFGLLVASLVITDYVYGLRYLMGWVSSGSGMAHADSDLDSSIGYIDEVYSDYLRYAGIAAPYGCVAEIGPGDSCGVAMRFLADGCARVDLVDRFYTKRDQKYHAKVYESLFSHYPVLAQKLPGVDFEDEKTFGAICRHYGADAASETFFRETNAYDFIVSRAVLEHVQDPVGSMQSMFAALRPGGWMLHKIDLRDHGMFTPEWHELKYLEVPEWIYRSMVYRSGRPNRRLTNVYRDVLLSADCDWKILVTRLAGVGHIEPHQEYSAISEELRNASLEYVRAVRQRFCASFANVSDEDLSVSGVFLVAHKSVDANG